MKIELEKKKIGMLLAICLASVGEVSANSISINLWDNTKSAGDHTLSAGEVGGVVGIDGQYWNNIGFAGGVHDFRMTQVLNDNMGNPGVATFTSTLMSGYVGGSGAGGASDGNRDLMSSYISYDRTGDRSSPDDSGNLSVSGLGGDYLTEGYDVYIYGDADSNARDYQISVGGVTQTIHDTATYGGVFVEGGQGGNENYVVFRGMNVSNFSIVMNASTGRGAVNGIQIVGLGGGGGAGGLSLNVNGWTGESTILNDGEGGVDLDYYHVKSAGGNLLAGEWDSLEDQDFEGESGVGAGWEELSRGGSWVSEGYLGGSSLVAGGEEIGLGDIFDGSSGEAGRDLEFVYLKTGGGRVIGEVTYFMPDFVLGDADFDGVVDGVDLALVKAHFGEASLGGDADHDRVTNLNDLFAVRNGIGGVVSVPEPGSLMVVVGGMVMAYRRRLR